MEAREAQLQAEIVTNNKDFSLVDYMKYDTTLGRDQNIDMGKVSTLICQD
jgi:hypothetical protein